VLEKSDRVGSMLAISFLTCRLYAVASLVLCIGVLVSCEELWSVVDGIVKSPVYCG
jgi:hypothetical protein